MKKYIGAMLLSLSLIALSGCAGLEHWGDEINAALKGMPATMSTYTQNGEKIDRVEGESFNITRDDRFDTTDSEGVSNADSNVMLISLGKNHISHVGSTMILAEKGLTDVTDKVDLKVEFKNNKPGTPFLNDFIEHHRNLWNGKGKTVIIRSQDGLPIATYIGDSVEIFNTDIPKMTWFNVDGKSLLVYRADYTVYDNELLKDDE